VCDLFFPLNFQLGGWNLSEKGMCYIINFQSNSSIHWKIQLGKEEGVI